MSPSKTTKAILVDLIPPSMSKAESLDRLQELEELVNTYGGMVVVKTHQRRAAPHPRTFIGPGKVEDLAKEGKELGVSLVVINDRLKPRQIYLIAEELRKVGIEVWDRLDLILKIFSKHAKTTEARLEIELASIRHMGPRIYGMGMELSRQGGGSGTRGGQGETNTEIMKRHLSAREEKIKEHLAHCQQVRHGHQQDRKRRGLLTVAIVGYTNAGKTTLLNKLTKRKEYAADELFATLDTRVGKMYLDSREILISDTIGFIQRLPPELLNAFASTLSEAMEADVLLQVVDGSDAHAIEHLKVVEEILERLGANKKPRILAINKMDDAKPGKPPLAFPWKGGMTEFLATVPISAKTGKGIEELKQAVAKSLK